MPYIKQEDRARMREPLEMLLQAIDTPGDLAYVLTILAIGSAISEMKPGGYASGALVIGVLETVKQEIYRRTLAPYEDMKAIENGDVFKEGL